MNCLFGMVKEYINKRFAVHLKFNLIFSGLNLVYQYCCGSLWNRFRMLCPQTTSKIQNAKILPWQTWFWWVSSFYFPFFYQFYKLKWLSLLSQHFVIFVFIAILYFDILYACYYKPRLVNLLAHVEDHFFVKLCLLT